ncbi:MAG: class I adenylate-forming enzyme family protein [Candidatus Binatia bacterium]|nr:class I adenylate-forming enzyme family protein [Candidatus Binatia bacterium]
MATPQEVDAQLLGPGAPFETTTEPVLGVPTQVFRTRNPSLRTYLENSVGFGDAEYAIFGDRRLTFAEHARSVASVAQALQEKYGVGHGDRVAILAANCPEWLITFWATTSLGAIAVGLNGWWTGDEILYGVGDSQPKVLVADRKRLARLDGAAPGVPVVEIEAEFAALEAHAPDAPLPTTPIAEDDAAIILYTSGTTGRPKGAVQTHRNVVALISLTTMGGLRNLMLAPPAPADTPAAPPTCLYVTNPLFHVSGLHTAAIMSMANGLRSVWNLNRFDAGETMKTIEREKCTSWAAMNTVVYRVLNHPDFGKYDLSSIRQLGGGGAPTSPELQRRIREGFPALGESGGYLGHGYGSTETGALATMIGGAEWEEFPESVGRPLPTVELEIRDEHGAKLADGEEGEILIRSPLLMLGYWNRPEATADTITKDRWLRTGDVGRILDGRLYLASRRRDLILRASENVYPAEIENRLEEHPDVAEVAVFGVPHEELGQEVKAVVVPCAGRSLDGAALASFVGETLAYYKVPAHWDIRTEALPRNATGKVLKQVLSGEAESSFIEE